MRKNNTKTYTARQIAQETRLPEPLVLGCIGALKGVSSKAITEEQREQILTQLNGMGNANHSQLPPETKQTKQVKEVTEPTEQPETNGSSGKNTQASVNAGREAAQRLNRVALDATMATDELVAEQLAALANAAFFGRFQERRSVGRVQGWQAIIEDSREELARLQGSLDLGNCGIVLEEKLQAFRQEEEGKLLRLQEGSQNLLSPAGETNSSMS